MKKKKLYCTPQAKVKRLNTESLMATESMPVDKSGDETIDNTDDIEAKEMPTYSVWED